MNKNHIYPVILAGGVGERFWPSSRAGRPKQMLSLLSSKSLFEETLDRAAKLAPAKNIMVVTRASLTNVIRKSAGKRKCAIVGEPVGKNTAPAIAVAASWVMRRDPKGVMVVLSSDHGISPVKDFVRTVGDAVNAALKDYLVVFGIPPMRPDVGYGYIQVGPSVGKAFQVKRFLEKPNAATARRFVKTRQYLWNSGMFVWKASRIVEEFARQMPDVHRLTRPLDRVWGTSRQKREVDAFYHKTPSQSIDYGIMENASRVAVVKATFHWDDVGSWEALWRIRKLDKDGNVLFGKALSVDNKDSLLFAEQGLIVGSGLENIVVVRTRDATLVLPRKELDKMKSLLAQIRTRKDIREYLQ